MTPDEARAILRDADSLYSRSMVEAAIDRLAETTTAELADKNPLVIGIMTGAVVLLGGLLTRWSFPLQVDYLHATRYRGSTTGGDHLHWLARPQASLKGRTVVVVDDILDGGQTLAGVVDFCREQGALEVRSIVLVNKANPRRDASITADYWALEAPDRYLFGYGMDAEDYLRNAPGIFAIKGR